MAVLPLPKVLLNSAKTIGRVAVAERVAEERLITSGRVVVAGGVAKERLTPLAVLWVPVVLR